jgi:hypothetical protein
MLSSAAAAAAVASEGSWGDDALLGGLSTPKPAGGSAAAAPLPPPTEEFEPISSTPTSETCIKTQITYRYNDKGEVEKVTRKFRVVTVRTRQPEGVRARREGLLKFGAALNAAENATLTKESPEDIFLELPSAGAEREERATREAFSGGVRGGQGGGGARARGHAPLAQTLPPPLSSRTLSHAHTHAHAQPHTIPRHPSPLLNTPHPPPLCRT